MDTWLQCYWSELWHIPLGIVNHLQPAVDDWYLWNHQILPQTQEANLADCRINRALLVHKGREPEHAHYIFRTLLFSSTPYWYNECLVIDTSASECSTCDHLIRELF